MKTFAISYSFRFINETLLKKLFTFSAIFFIAILLTACEKPQPPFVNTDLTGSPGFAKNFTIKDTSGKVRTLADFKGKVVVLFFGYTHCPDICPTAMAKLVEVKNALGENANKLQVLFVTVDPSRDTNELLKHYMHAFDPSFIGLRPENEEKLSEIKQGFHISSAKADEEAIKNRVGNNYTIDHTAGSYIFDSKGNLRLYIGDGQSLDAWVHDMKILM